MILSLVLFFISIIGFVLYRNHALILLLALELILLSITVIVLTSAIIYDSSVGQILGIVYITVAGAESAIGLSILVAYYRLRGTISLGNLFIYL
jgi:NADH-ubiquinone oxidoreductase chain 4L